ncbi:MAG: hypothetical protein KDE19_00050 [Caldilineaceae bacterium]|nr:hypothetical protein [Caldilineaceae bacterium]
MRHLRRNRLLVIGAYRADERQVVAPLQLELHRMRLLTELMLTPLDSTAVGALIETIPKWGATSGN